MKILPILAVILSSCVGRGFNIEETIGIDTNDNGYMCINLRTLSGVTTKVDGGIIRVEFPEGYDTSNFTAQDWKDLRDC